MSLFQIDTGREWRGGQRQSLLLVRALADQGLKPVFAVHKDGPLHDRALQAGIPVLPLKFRGEADPGAVFRLALAMKRKGCRLVHFHDAHAVTVGSAAAGLAKVPIRVLTRRVDFPIRDNPVSRRKYTKGIDRIIAVSDGVRRVLVDGGLAAENVTVIPDGIDFTPYEAARDSQALRREFAFDPEDYLVGIVAHLADHKGHAYLIEATRILKTRAPSIRLIIVGEGPLMMDLTRQVKNSGLENVVFFLGFREDVPSILSSLDLFVLSSYLEGLGSVLMDASACRLPIVATRTGGIPEIIEDGRTGLLVPPRNPAELAGAIYRLYSDRELAARLGHQAHEAVYRKFSAETMAGRVVDLYRDLARAKGIRIG